MTSPGGGATATEPCSTRVRSSSPRVGEGCIFGGVVAAASSQNRSVVDSGGRVAAPFPDDDDDGGRSEFVAGDTATAGVWGVEGPSIAER